MLLNVTRNAEYYLDSNDSEHWTSRRTNISEPQICYDFSLEFNLASEGKFDSCVKTTCQETDLILNYNDFNCSTTFDLNEQQLANITIVIENPSKFDLSSESLNSVIISEWKEKIVSLFERKFLEIINDFAKSFKM